jgi:hypothetical protein
VKSALKVETAALLALTRFFNEVTSAELACIAELLSDSAAEFAETRFFSEVTSALFVVIALTAFETTTERAETLSTTDKCSAEVTDPDPPVAKTLNISVNVAHVLSLPLAGSSNSIFSAPVGADV